MHLKHLIQLFQKNGVDNIWEKRILFFLLTQQFFIFLHSISYKRHLRSLSTVPFSEKTVSGAFKYLAQTMTKFLLLTAENTKNSRFWYFNDHNPGSNKITRQMNPLWALFISQFYFCISRPSKFGSTGSPYVLVHKIPSQKIRCWWGRPETILEATFLELIKKAITYKFSEDFASHRKKTNWVVVFSVKPLRNILNRNDRW